jgi:hypothetical protein
VLPKFLTVDELAAELWPSWDVRRGRRWVYRQRERGLPAVQFGRQIVFDPQEVSNWINGQRTKP